MMEEQGSGEKKETRQRTVTRQDYAEAQAKMEKMVQNSEITAEQMQQRLVEMRKMIGRSSEPKESSQRSVTRQDYAEAEAKMEKMVQAGEITAEQMRQRLAGMRKMMGRPAEPKETRQRTVTRQDYAEAQAKMEKMVQAGEITAEQMRQRLIEMRKMMGRPAEPKESSQRTVTRQDYAEAQAKMEKMVQAGEITREQMQQRLASMRKWIGD
jgi:hypothetical protein